MNMKSKLPLAGLLAALLAAQAPAKAGPVVTVEAPSGPVVIENTSMFLALRLSDINTQKALIIAQNLPMSELEAAASWPLHRDYEAELGRLTDRKLELVDRFARQFESMTDRDAGLLAKDIFELEARHTDLKRNYFKKFVRVMPATEVARFFQIEYQLNLAFDLQLKSELPLIQ